MNNIINRLIGMNAETRARTVTAFLTAVLDFLAAFHIVRFSDAQTNAIYKIVLTIVTAFVWSYASHYKNNDFTEEACEGTGLTRLLKAEKKAGVYTEPREMEIEEEGGDADESSNIG